MQKRSLRKAGKLATSVIGLGAISTINLGQGNNFHTNLIGGVAPFFGPTGTIIGSSILLDQVRGLDRMTRKRKRR